MGKLLLRILREIKSSLGQFLSLVLVIAVGSFMFAGLFANISSIHNSVDAYYEEQDMADIWVRFNGIDIATVSSLAAQMDMQAEGRYSRMFDGTLNSEAIEVKLCSVTNINAVRLESGNLPQDDYEIVVDTKFAQANSLTLGSTLHIELEDSSVPMTVCGIGNSPENAWKVSATTSGLIKQKLYAAGYTNENTMRELIRGSEQYQEKYDELMEEFEDPQADLDEAKSKLMEKEQDFSDSEADSREQLNDAKEDLADARDKLNEASSTLSENEREQQEKISDAQGEIDDRYDTIEENQDKLDEKMREAKQKFVELYGQVESAQQEIGAKQAQLDAGFASVSQARTQLIAQREEAAVQYAAQIAQAEAASAPQEEIEALEEERDQALSAIDVSLEDLDQKENALNSSQDALKAAQKELDGKKSQIDVQKQLAEMEFKIAQSKIDNAKLMLDSQQKALDSNQELVEKQLDSAKEQLDAGQESYDNSVEKLGDQEGALNEKLADSSENLDDAWDGYYEKEQDFLDAKQEAVDTFNNAMLGYNEVVAITDDPEAVADMMSEQEYYLSHTLRDEQPSAKSVKGSMDIVGAISYVLPVVFFLVAALIAFISMSKMVENQRMQIAVMQAMGIEKGKILSGYLMYSLIASLLGSFGFAALGNKLIPMLLTHMFTTRFILPPVVTPTYWYLIVAPFVLGLLFSGSATIIAARGVFKEEPAQAMRPRPPKKSKPILLQRMSGIWSRMGYAAKLISRNIFLNKKKIFTSSVGVLGCVTLALTGLSVQTSVQGMQDLYQSSLQYDIVIKFKDEVDDQALAQCPYVIAEQSAGGGLRTTLPDEQDTGLLLQVLPAGSTAVSYHDADGKDIKLTEKGVVLTRSVAQDYDVEQGDFLKLSYGDTVFRVRVASVAEQYAGGNSLVSEEYIKSLEIDFTPDEVFIKMADPADMSAAQAYFEGIDGVESVTNVQEMSDIVRDMLAMLNVVVRITIAAAGVLSVTVIYNITSINIFERTRELATLRVLGYYKDEAGRLVFAETLVITGVGFLLGVPGGVLLFQGLAQAFANSGMYLPQSITLSNIAFALVFVYVLSIGTNLLLSRRIARIDMVEALKSVE